MSYIDPSDWLIVDDSDDDPPAPPNIPIGEEGDGLDAMRGCLFGLLVTGMVGVMLWLLVGGMW